MVLQLKQKPNYNHGFFCYIEKSSDNFVGQKMLSLVTYLAGVDLDMLNSVQIKKKT